MPPSSKDTNTVSLNTVVLNSRDQHKKTMAPTIYAPLKAMLGYRLCIKTT